MRRGGPAIHVSAGRAVRQAHRESIGEAALHLTGTDEALCGVLRGPHLRPSITALHARRHQHATAFPLLLIYSCIKRIPEQFLTDDFSRDGTNGTAGVMAAIKFFCVCGCQSRSCCGTVECHAEVVKRESLAQCRLEVVPLVAGPASFGGGDGRARDWPGSRASLQPARASKDAIGP
ncbi:hypothetical protein E2C01_096702 [Portunus trituberculatus]|uniref:Uncharacterized protein n=1 Tax=Portunus trituberculatus TaxID=210409 RepID=A0A5B7K3K5_PORTR|nr:hypothetical protein [Portunus trituberculatus]